MKKLVILSMIIFANTIFSFAQKTDKFDIISFQTPKGWQKAASQNSVQLAVEDTNGGICLITIFKSLPATNDSKENFETAWESIVKETVTVKSAPQMQPAANENGWIAESGFAQYESDGKKGIVMLITASGNGKMVNVLILTNTEGFQSEIESFLVSVDLPKVEATTQTNTSLESGNTQPDSPVTPKNDGYKFSSVTFDDGWTSAAQNDWVLVSKGQMKVYLFYALPYNASDFSGTGVRARDYYWDTYVSKYFNIQTKQYQDGGESIGSFQPNYVEGWATDRTTGERRFIAMYLGISTNTGWVTIASAPNENLLRQTFPKANAAYQSDLSAMSHYNHFPVATSDVIGRWSEGDTSTAHWYYVTPSGYEGYAGMTIASRSASFTFGNGGIYNSEHSGTTGSAGNLNSFKQNYKGNYKVTDWSITATNRWKGQTESFKAWLQIIRGGRVLVLQNGGLTYNLVRVK